MEMNQQEYDLIHRMITESGEMWRGSQDRTQPNSEVVICRHPERAFYLSWVGNVEGNINGWTVEVRPLDVDHAREFHVAFGTHYYYWFGSVFQDGKFRLRAYIKNGRKSDWTISIESCTVVGFENAAQYGKTGTGVIVRGRVAAANSYEPKTPDFDDRPWSGPYDDE